MRLRLDCLSRAYATKQWPRNFSSASVTHSVRLPIADEQPQPDQLQNRDTEASFIPSADGHRTLRTRLGGKDPLPLPPVLDPRVTAARKRHKQPKAPKPRHDDLTPFQKELSLNPWARILATPIRSCCMTEATLPSHFLQPFSTIFKPSHNPLPTPTRKPLEPRKSVDRDRAPIEDDTATDSDQHDVAADDASTPDTKPILTPHFVPSNTIPDPREKSYVLNSYTLLQRLNSKKAWHRVVPQDAPEWFGKRDKRSWVWDERMPDIVLEGLRSDLGRRLCWGFRHVNAGLVRADKGEEREAIGARLSLTGGHGNVDEEGQSGGRAEGEDGVPEFDILRLLGAEKARELLQGTVFEDHERVVLVKSPLTRKTVMALTRLDAYLDTPF